MTEPNRRAELADFLRSRRERLTPEQVGLSAAGRRRTPGLRREEVAMLAETSATWYAWLEQRRDIKVSAPLLDRLAHALQLTPDERRHLFALAGQPLPMAVNPPLEVVTPALERFIHGLRDQPAYVLGRRWDYLAWNAAACAVLGDIGALAPDRRNLMRRLFLDPARRHLHTDWACIAANTVARFRADSAPFIGDPWFDALIADLRCGSPEFRRWWDRHDVRDAPNGRKDLQHPTVGRLVFEDLLFRVPDAPHLRVVVYTPLAEHDTPAKLRALLREAPVPALV